MSEVGFDANCFTASKDTKVEMIRSSSPGGMLPTPGEGGMSLPAAPNCLLIIVVIRYSAGPPRSASGGSALEIFE
jgi:hypothetical protein